MIVKTYEARVKVNRMDGGIPCDPDVIKNWLSAHGIQDDAELAEKIADNVLAEDEMEDALRILTTGFLLNEKGQPCIESRCIHSGLKETAEVMGIYSAYPGIREVIRKALRVEPELIPLAESKKAVNIMTRPCHTMTQKGPRSSLKRFQTIENAEFTFQVVLMDRQATVAELCPKKKNKDGKEEAAVSRKLATVSEEMLKELLNGLCRFVCFGTNHSQGSGKGELLSLKEIV